MNKHLVHINCSSLGKRALLLLPSLLLMPMGIACYFSSGLGATPGSIFMDGMHVVTGLSVGVVSNYNNWIYFVLMLFLGRRHIGLGTVAVAATCGTLIDLFNGLLQTAFPMESTAFPLRFLILCVGCVLFAVGIGLYIVVECGIGSTEFLTVFIVEKTGFSLKWVRIVLDVLFMSIGFFLGGTLGIGTVLGVAATGPISAWVVDRTQGAVNAWCGPMYKTEQV